jgi:predicted RNase H-like HicB family nuclease
MHDYIALVHKEAESDFGVSFPDFPGVVTAGRTLEEARAMAVEALALHVDGLLEDGEVLPAPSNLDEIMADRENRDGAVIVVSVGPAARGKAVRVNVTLPRDMLERIDRFADAHGYTRSGFLARAARRVLAMEGAAAEGRAEDPGAAHEAYLERKLRDVAGALFRLEEPELPDLEVLRRQREESRRKTAEPSDDFA